MSISRRFLLASSLARLIQKERGGTRVIEGYFPEREGRTSSVQLEEAASFLILRSSGPAGQAEERVQIPPAHAQALLDVTAGEVDYVRTKLSVGSREIFVRRLIAPGRLDLVSVAFEHVEEARSFSPLPWFGPEVTADRRYQNQAIAFGGVPEPLEIPLSNAALHSLSDTLEGRSPAVRPQASRPVQVAPLFRAEAYVEVEHAGRDERLMRDLARTVQAQRAYN